MRKGEIENRLDCYYIKAVLTNSLKSHFDSFPLNKLVSTFSGGTPDKSNPKYWNGEIFWVSPKDFKGLVISESEDKITNEGLQDSSTKFVEKENVLVVVRSGVLQHTLPVAVNKIGVAINQDVKALEIKDKSFLNPYYLVFYLNTFQEQLLPLIIKHGTTVQSINTRQFDKIKIPVPPIEVQKHIIKRFEAAYNVKRARESEAKSLLDGVDTYLLERLGVEKPARTEPEKTFITLISKLSGSRFDPFYHHAYYNLLEKQLHEAKYPVVHLSRICSKITDGTHYTPKYQETGVLFLSVKNVRHERFDLQDVKYISEVEHAELTKRCKPEFNDILLTKIGTVGLAVVVPDSLPDFSIFVSLALLKPKLKLVNPSYLSAYLNSSLTDFQAQRAVKGVGVPDWHLENIRRTEILLPPLKIQEEIVAHIKSIRERAKELEREAQTEVELAKAEVERMILGEVSADA